MFYFEHLGLGASSAWSWVKLNRCFENICVVIFIKFNELQVSGKGGELSPNNTDFDNGTIYNGFPGEPIEKKRNYFGTKPGDQEYNQHTIKKIFPIKVACHSQS